LQLWGQALKIGKITEAREGESPYDPDFVPMIKQGEKDLKNGKGIPMTLDELENLCK